MMKCRICGTVIPDGKLFCPSCGEEVRLVPDFESYDMQKEKQRREEEAQLRRQELIRRQRRVSPARAAALIAVTVALSAALTFLCIVQIRRNGDKNPDYLRSRIAAYRESGRTQDALRACGTLLALDPYDREMALLYAQLLFHTGETDRAIRVLRDLIEQNPDDTAAYAQLLPIYEKLGDSAAITALLEQTDDLQLHMEYALYAAKRPSMSLVSGQAYPYGTRLTLRCQTGTIYYSTDGRVPDETSTIYTGPILLPAGISRINAVSINQMGVRSAVVSGVFTVKARTAAASELMPPEETPEYEEDSGPPGGSGGETFSPAKETSSWDSFSEDSLSENSRSEDSLSEASFPEDYIEEPAYDSLSPYWLEERTDADGWETQPAARAE